MSCRFVFVLAAVLLFAGSDGWAQQATTTASTDADFWVAHWAQPKPILYGAEEEDFSRNMKDIMFSLNNYDQPLNPSTLDADVQWLKDHPTVRFYVDGYASSRGDVIYNLALSQRRAEWVKQALVDRGIPENRIVVAAGWGELYPVCLESNDECWARNKLVRFAYSPN